MSRRAYARRLGFLLALAIVLVAIVAAARPGGGGSYHGGGGGSRSSGGGGYHGGGGSSGSSGGGSALDIIALVILCVEHPVLGLFVLVIGGGIVVVHFMQTTGRTEWSTASPAATYRHDPTPPAPPSLSPRTQLEALRQYDESFSVVIFEDFVSALYAHVHAARGNGALPTLSAFLAPEALAVLAQTGLVEVKTIIVGALRILHVSASPGAVPTFAVTIEIEANYNEVSQGNHERAWYVRERWHLARRASAPSRTPDRARVFACPSCGAPLDGVIASRCKHCNKDVCTGEFDWVVRGIELVEREARGPMLTAETQEEGTDEPTVVDPEARGALAALNARDPAFTWDAFQVRVGLVFSEFQRAWSARDLTAMRPFLSDNLFEVETYWIRAYLAQRLRNVTENARITRLELARVTSDRFFDAITVRLFAASLDYTLSADPGKPEHLVCGSRSRERTYTEYWTFLRSARRAGPPRDGRVCPSCGAPLAINMAGSCTYCNAKVTAGDFDWVLSRIEQDESYTG